MRQWRGYRLSRFQVRAVEAIRAGRNVLVCAPTGAGKTLVAEYAIEDAVRLNRRCIYTSPIKALSNQKYRDFRDDPEVDVGLMTGDVTIRPEARVLIMTTEILRNAIFENPELLHDVEYVVFDEVHFLDDPERGTVWEESLIFAPEGIRFICLSATIRNSDELGAWLGEIRGEDVEVIRSEKRPVPLHQFLYTARSGAFDFQKLAKVRKREGKPEPGGRGRGRDRGRDRGRGGRGGKGRGRRWSFETEQPPDPSDLLSELADQERLPALVFSFSRRECEKLAKRNAWRELLNEEELARMRALQEELVQLFQLSDDALEGAVLSTARHGVAWHHAGMLPVEKELVERLFTSGLLKLLFTTETFALGINMPARAVVFTSLRKFDGVSFDYMRTRDFLQMAGRAGRQGIDDEGLVYSALSQRDLFEAPLERLERGKPEPVHSRFRLSFSTLLHLVSRLGRERVYEAWEKSFNQFQHREENTKARERNRRKQRRLIDAHLAFLSRLGYLDEDDQPTARGELARSINGYELQLTELCFQGALETLGPEALAVVFVGLVYEERRRGAAERVPAHLYGGVRRHIDGMLRSLCVEAAAAGIEPPLKRPDWSLTPAVVAWFRGAEFWELGEVADVPAGDLCRTFRMALQLMRQLRRSIDRDWDLGDRLSEAAEGLNREEVDARRQLELG